MTILHDVLEILLGSFSQIATAMGGALTSFASSIMVDSSGDTDTITTFGVLVLVFASIALGLGLFRWCLNFITSLGGRNR
jgi:hypothetical protein